jgi:hypothetical protein
MRWKRVISITLLRARWLRSWSRSSNRRIRLSTACCRSENGIINRRIIRGTTVRITGHRFSKTPNQYFLSQGNLPRTTTRIVEPRTYIMREAILCIYVTDCEAQATCSASAVTAVPMNYVRHYMDRYMVEWIAYSPPFALFTPKLLPTTPLQRQDWPAALVHDAVTVAPTFRQDIARFSRAGDAEMMLAKRAARERRRRCIMDCRSDKSPC